MSALLVIVSAGLFVGVRTLLRTRPTEEVTAWDRPWRSTSTIA
jgi:hypothetical protein